MRTLGFACLAFGLTACAGTKEPAPAPPAAEKAAPAPALSTNETTRRLTVLHTSDNESDLLGSGKEEGEVARGGVSRVAALVRTLQKKADEPMLVVAAGDTMMPAPELRLEVDGKNAVAVSNNLIGYAVSALGNHEWDLGEAFLADYLGDSAFPYVSATTSPKDGPLADRWVAANDGEPLWAADLAGKLAPRTRVCVGERTGTGKDATCSGLVVGVIGATTEMLRGISNVPDHVGLASTLDEVRTTVQAHADQLAAAGVDVVILLSHLQDVRKELKLVADGLTGVDIIVAGGGDNRLADKDDRLFPGDEPDRVCGEIDGDCYPILLSAADGRPVIVVSTDGQLRYIGTLSVGFDAEGVLTDVSKTSRPWPVDETSLQQLGAEPATDVVAFEDALVKQLEPLSTPFANVAYYLEGAREFVRNRQTNLGDLSADSIAWAARKHKPRGVRDIAFAARNGGGIRAAIGSVDRDTYKKGGGPLRPLDVKSALRFDGPVVVVTTTHEVVYRTFESALREVGRGRGQFPQVSSDVLLEYVEDAADQAHELGPDGKVKSVGCLGQHVWTLKVTPPGKAPIVIVEDGKVKTPRAKITFATLAFLARGGDGWFPGATQRVTVKPAVQPDGDVTEQWAFRSFIEAKAAAGEWNDGVSYKDPSPKDPASFTRIKRVEQKVTRSSACAEK